MPQNVKGGSGWERDFPDEVQRKEWVHKLGNLMLLSGIKNSKASDRDFEHKKTTYFLKRRKGAQVSSLSPLCCDADVSRKVFVYLPVEMMMLQDASKVLCSCSSVGFISITIASGNLCMSHFGGFAHRAMFVHLSLFHDTTMDLFLHFHQGCLAGCW